MREIPEQLRTLPNARFVLEKDKKPVESEWNTKNNYEYTHEKVKEWLSKGGDIALLLPQINEKTQLIVVDLDIAKYDKELTEKILSELPPTFIVKSKSGGLHLYYKTDMSLHKMSIKDEIHRYDLDKEVELVDVRVAGFKITIPPSKGYEVYRAYNIAKITPKRLKEVLDNYFKEFVRVQFTNTIEGEDTASKILEHLITHLEKKGYPHKLNPRGNILYIKCPFHDDGKNLDFAFKVYEKDGKRILAGYDNHDGKYYHPYEIMKALDIPLPDFARKEERIYADSGFITYVMDPERGIYYISRQGEVIDIASNIYILDGVKTYITLENTSYFKLKVKDTISGYIYTIEGTLSDVIKQLKDRTYVIDKNKFENAINSILATLEKERIITIERRISSGWGWFYDPSRKRIIGVDVKEKINLPREQIKAEEVKQSFLLLKQIVDKVYKTEEMRHKIWNILYYAFMSPFSFVSKQLNNPIKSVVLLYGPSGTGKTTLNMLIMSMLGIPNTNEFNVGADSIATSYQFARHLSFNTYPLLCDEAGNLLKEDTFNKIREMIKTAGESTTSIRSRKGNEPIPLRVVFLTSNFGVKYVDSSTRLRMIIVKTDLLGQREQSERKEIAQFIEEHKEVLSRLHYYFLQRFLFDKERNKEVVELLKSRKALNEIGYIVFYTILREIGYSDEEIKEILPSVVNIEELNEDEERKTDFEIIIDTIREEIFNMLPRMLTIHERENASIEEQITTLFEKNKAYGWMYVSKKVIGGFVLITPEISELVFKRKGVMLEAGVLAKIARDYHLIYDSRKVGGNSRKGLIIYTEYMIKLLIGDDKITTSEVVKKSETGGKLPLLPPTTRPSPSIYYLSPPSPPLEGGETLSNNLKWSGGKSGKIYNHNHKINISNNNNNNKIINNNYHFLPPITTYNNIDNDNIDNIDIERDEKEIAREIISSFLKEKKEGVPLLELIDELYYNTFLSKEEIEELIEDMLRKGELFEPRHGFVAML